MRGELESSDHTRGSVPVAESCTVRSPDADIILKLYSSSRAASFGGVSMRGDPGSLGVAGGTEVPG